MGKEGGPILLRSAKAPAAVANSEGHGLTSVWIGDVQQEILETPSLGKYYSRTGFCEIREGMVLWLRPYGDLIDGPSLGRGFVMVGEDRDGFLWLWINPGML